ncbi:MAG: anthranilate synthase component II [Flavobacteriales bacterium]
MRILVVDFYDSFVFNLVHYFTSLGVEVDVLSDAQVNLEDLSFLKHYEGIVLSPGPGLPHETQSMMPIIAFCQGSIPVFGVCLGMQGLGLSMGGSLVNMKEVRHGVTTKLSFKDNTLIFKGLVAPLTVGLYHSWKVEGIDTSHVAGRDERGTIMALASTKWKQFGVQFHPESILTEQGKQMIYNVVHYLFAPSILA